VRYPNLAKSIDYLLQQCGPISGRTRMIKLLYLADREWARTPNKGPEFPPGPYTEARYYKYNHGPFAKEILVCISEMDGVELVEERDIGPYGIQHRYRAASYSRLHDVPLNKGFAEILRAQYDRWERAPLQDLLKHVYDAEFEDVPFGQALLITS
jgi:hypothetical protein